jgi:hypothetical protein
VLRNFHIGLQSNNTRISPYVDYLRLALVAMQAPAPPQTFEVCSSILGHQNDIGLIQKLSQADATRLAHKKASGLWDERLARICYHTTFPEPAFQLPNLDFEFITTEPIFEPCGKLLFRAVVVTPIVWRETLLYDLYQFASATGYEHVRHLVQDTVAEGSECGFSYRAYTKGNSSSVEELEMRLYEACEQKFQAALASSSSASSVQVGRVGKRAHDFYEDGLYEDDQESWKKKRRL